MSSLYEVLISDLRIKLKNNNIEFKQFFSLINNEEYEEINKIINDEIILTLIENIVIERERIGNNMEKKLNNLFWLNERLLQFGEEQQVSIKKARKILKTKVFINIYDLETEKYEKRTTNQLLKKELKKHMERRFPLFIAKKYIILKCFLIKL